MFLIILISILFLYKVYLIKPHIWLQSMQIMYCCEKCFKEKAISNYIRKYGNKHKYEKCSFCNSKNIYLIKPYKLRKYLLRIIYKKYEDIDNGTGAMYDSETKEYIDYDYKVANTYSIYSILVDEYDVFNFDDTNKMEKLLEYIFYKSNNNCFSYKEDMLEEMHYPTEEFLVLKGDLYRYTNEGMSWDMFVYITKYYNRFFDTNKQVKKRKKLLAKLSTILKKMGENIENGKILYRARDYNNEKINEMSNCDFYREISPPPNLLSKNNRMSPAGISYTYLNDDYEGCLIEARIENNANFLVGKFKIIKGLNIINLSKKIFLPIEYNIFSKKYKHSYNWINDFIKRFTSEISKPIEEEDNILEYIPTQVLAEFIRYLGFDGIKFQSSLKKGTYNYTLFCGPSYEISNSGMPYKENRYPNFNKFTNWLKLEEIYYGKSELIFKNIYKKQIIK